MYVSSLGICEMQRKCSTDTMPLLYFAFLLYIVPSEELNYRDIAITKHAFVNQPYSTSCKGKDFHITGRADYIERLIIYKDNQVIFKYHTKNNGESIKHVTPEAVWYFTARGINTRGNFYSTIVTMSTPRLNYYHYGRYWCTIDYFVKGDSRRKTKSFTFMDLQIHGTGGGNPCKNEWVYYGLDDRCIKLFLFEKNWTAAREYCRDQHGGDLIKIKTEPFNYFLSSLPHIGHHASFWIGLRDLRVNGIYRWLDERKNADYTKMNPSQRVLKGQCVVRGRNTNSKWEKIPCKELKTFMCERSRYAFSKEIVTPPVDSYPLVNVEKVAYYLLITGLIVLAIVTPAAIVLLMTQPMRAAVKVVKVAKSVAIAVISRFRPRDKPFLQAGKTTIVYAKSLENRYGIGRRRK